MDTDTIGKPKDDKRTTTLGNDSRHKQPNNGLVCLLTVRRYI